MDEHEYQTKLSDAKGRERRYQWAITTILSVSLLIIGFMGGLAVQSYMLREQVTRNTVEIRVLRETMSRIEDKIDRLIREDRYGGSEAKR